MAKTKKTTTKTTGRKAELAAKTKKELVAMARELGVPAAGAMSKADLVVVVGGTENSAAPKTETPAEVVPVEVGQLRKPRRGRNVHRVTEVNVEAPLLAYSPPRLAAERNRPHPSGSAAAHGVGPPTLYAREEPRHDKPLPT